MRKIFVACIFIILFSTKSITASGQNYSLNKGFVSGGNVTTCSGKFFDSNPTSTYSPNEHYSVTFCSGKGDKIIQILFANISIAASDTLFSFDGNSINSPVIDTITNTTRHQYSITPSIYNTSGCITFTFISNGLDEKDGWEADLKCIYPCNQKINGIGSSSPGKDALGYTNVCFGEQVDLSIKTLYPDNNATYHQSDSSSVFTWIFGDGKDTSGRNLLSVKHKYSSAGGYNARLIITDSNGCSNNQPIQFAVRTSLKPYFNITPPPSVCLFDTAVIKPAAEVDGFYTVTSPTGSFVTMPVSGDSVFLPDNPPQCFSSSIVIEQFAPNQTLQNLNDLQGIFMNMEHSYLGDLTISIEAPNGAKVFLKATVEGSANDGTFLGEPVDETLWGNPSDNTLAKIRGKGYDYSFNSTPRYGTMWNEVSKYSYTFTDNAGQIVKDHYYLPAGSYKSEESMLSLIGTSLNGKWTLEVCDKQAIDNGFLFNWHIEFKKSIYPNAETYTVPIYIQRWSAAPGLQTSQNTTAIVTPQTPGVNSYQYVVNDGFGCTYDTTIKLLVQSIPAKPNLGADTSVCVGRSIVLKVENFENINNYHWSTNQKGTSNISVSQPGSYWLETTNTKGCKNRDTINVLLLHPFTVNLGSDSLYCLGRPTILSAISSKPVVSWKWSSGDTTSKYTAPGKGSYWAEAKDATGCLVRDTINVLENPVNTFRLPNDTTICERSDYRVTVTPQLGTTVMWNDSSAGYSHVISKAGTYSATAEYKGCIKISILHVKVKPLPIFSLGKDTTLCYGYSLQLKASYAGAKYRWNTGSTDSIYNATRAGQYWTEASLDGCTYRDTVIMQQKICSCDIKMPNAFSPNGDGINDVYKPTIKCFPRDYHLSVFNRDGQLVFDTKNYQDFWDGKFNGNTLPVATYYYILTLYNQDLLQSEKTSGSITLLR